MKVNVTRSTFKNWKTYPSLLMPNPIEFGQIGIYSKHAGCFLFSISFPFIPFNFGIITHFLPDARFL